MDAVRNLFVPLLLVALLAASCAEAGESGPVDDSTTTAAPTSPSTVPIQPGALARADVARATTTDVAADELAAQVTANNDFGFALFRAAVTQGENGLLSPYSIAAALTMTYAGARGNTAVEMAEVLNIIDPARIHAVRNELDLQITSVEDSPIPDDAREPFQIRVANSLWGQAGFPFLDEFLSVLAENYDAGLNLVDFVTAAEEARVAINDWVEEQTAGRIVDLIPPGVIDSMTRLVLVNAIWFKASWAEQWDPELTADGSFTTLDGSTVAVPFMYDGGGKIPYGVGDGYRAVRIPYAGDAAMLVILPDEGRFEEIAARLDGKLIAELAANSSTRDIELAMPKFEFRSEFSLPEALRSLGMVDAFGDADFTSIEPSGQLFIQDVIHQAFIAVDETGTEAAAATAVIAGFTAAGEPPLALAIDRPFLFIIEHSSTGEILFLGQVANPA